ncbi:MAG: hypothetical protein Q9207_000273 [Kuettlingeria erythrocarpa]
MVLTPASHPDLEQRMRSATEDVIDWGFSPVSDLIFSLSEAAAFRPDGTASPSPSPEKITSPRHEPEQRQSRSDLGNFDRLWAFLGQPLDLSPPEVPSLASYDTGVDVDESTTLHLTISKGVRWRDDAEGGELADIEEAKCTSSVTGLSKLQRKKLAKKERKAAREEKRQRGTLLMSSSENDSEFETRIAKGSPDRRAVIQQILHGPAKTPDGGSQPIKAVSQRASLPIDPGAWPIANPHLVTPVPKSRATPVDRLALVVGLAKKERLMTKLKERFVDDRPCLMSLSTRPFTSTGDNGTQDGIHVFVDASNIMIGFHDAVKVSRGLPLQARIRCQLSFDRLALILERGRPASKRVLVGSDNLDAIDEAKRIGYEANILDRVLKAKELTPRQKKFSCRANGSGTSGGSGSETTAAAVFAKEKWVEQAVDEILHLKILESVVDAKKPSTMVLATGDAAEAEYSQGFLRMAERALEKGWKVELVSFRKNMSGMYKRKEFKSKWKGKFTIVELDKYMEELLDHES